MLHLHRAERADGLAEALAELLSEPLEDPFAPEVVAVPTRGMERWLSQRLGGRLGATPGCRDGICANVLFPPPRRLLGDALAAASEVDPDGDPWRPERAVWPLLEVLDDCADEPWMRLVSAHLGSDCDPPDPVRRARRLGVAGHLTSLFDRYARHRPGMVRAWAAGEDGHGAGERLLPEARWQAELWRALRKRIALPGPAERLEPACARLREDEGSLQLPPRVSLFGLTRLPAGDLQVLRALAARRDVHLFLLHPSPALWQKLAESGGGVKTGVPTRHEDPTVALAAHPLLTSWGRDAREMQLVLGDGEGDSEDEHVDHHHPLTLSPATLLERIQADVLGDRAPPGVPFPGRPDHRAALDPSDPSIQVHSCHGRARQVEVLRDAVLHTLAEDQTLEPRDVIVMCPDIETFAPLIQATFGAGELASEEASSRDLRVRLADRSLRQTNGVLAVIAELLQLADQRLSASQVLDFADREPVRRRFGLLDDDLTRLQGWIKDAGVRWGLDAAHRAPFKLSRVPSGTWRAGLDRVLLGVTMTELDGRRFAGVLPLEDVESGVIDLVGRFAELIARLGQAVEALTAPQPVESWVRSIALAADSLTATEPPEAWQRGELQRLLEELLAEASSSGAGGGVALSLTEVRTLLRERLAGHPTRANFRTGHLTICTLYPMRSVPHRVVCLLGLDDGSFPRKAPRDGDDLMLDRPQVGERDPRSEDRQMLLDALMAATGRLIITYTGNDERTNISRPPAVPVGELLDVIDATARGEAAAARDQVLIRHPLQPFDPRNFDRGALLPDRAWSFDEVTLAGARALSGPRNPPRAFLSGRLPAPEEPVVALADLVRFVQHPVKAFLRQRLRISVGERSDEVDDALPVELDSLERWGVGQRLLEARLAGVDGHAAIQAEIARGLLPPSVLGKPVIDEQYPVVDAILGVAGALAQGEAPNPDPLDVHVELPGGRRLSGTVNARRGDLLLCTTFSRVAAKHRLSAWVRLLAATASEPERALSAVTVGRASGSRTVCVAKIEPLGADAESRRRNANAYLAALVDLYARGMREPLPLPCLSAAAYAEAAASGRDPVTAARLQWESRYGSEREDQEPEHQLVLGQVLSFQELISIGPHEDESGPGWDASERSRFGRLARRLWDGLLAHEQVSSGA